MIDSGLRADMSDADHKRQHGDIWAMYPGCLVAIYFAIRHYATWQLSVGGFAVALSCLVTIFAHHRKTSWAYLACSVAYSMMALVFAFVGVSISLGWLQVFFFAASVWNAFDNFRKHRR